NEPLVEQILESVVRAVDVPVTVKIRTGSDPLNRNGVAIAQIAQACGVSAITVHGRTRQCKFVGEVEYN
ncbi:MAG TPA: tRNA dihydrouridine synthase DusB, partial [Gammaproteobacteria bacterium]|nr:tRNA dihydrouridine synthase DusB [Gammaproteobacteria bacterium]